MTETIQRFMVTEAMRDFARGQLGGVHLREFSDQVTARKFTEQTRLQFYSTRRFRSVEAFELAMSIPLTTMEEEAAIALGISNQDLEDPFVTRCKLQVLAKWFFPQKPCEKPSVVPAVTFGPITLECLPSGQRSLWPIACACQSMVLIDLYLCGELREVVLVEAEAPTVSRVLLLLEAKCESVRAAQTAIAAISGDELVECLNFSNKFNVPALVPLLIQEARDRLAHKTLRIADVLEVEEVNIVAVLMKENIDADVATLFGVDDFPRVSLSDLLRACQSLTSIDLTPLNKAPHASVLPIAALIRRQWTRYQAKEHHNSIIMSGLKKSAEQVTPGRGIPVSIDLGRGCTVLIRSLDHAVRKYEPHPEQLVCLKRLRVACLAIASLFEAAPSKAPVGSWRSFAPGAQLS